MMSYPDTVTSTSYAHLVEYQLVALPSEEVTIEILEEWKTFFETHDFAEVFDEKPQIVVTRFLAKEEMEETLVRWIQNICSLQKGFAVTLNNYSGFPPDNIHMRVQDPRPFSKIVSSLTMLNGFIEANDCPPMEVHARPNLPLAGFLPAHLYLDAISHFAQRMYHNSFTVDRLLLLRRDAACDRFELVNTFVLPPAAPL